MGRGEVVSRTKLYKVWNTMKYRCKSVNPKDLKYFNLEVYAPWAESFNEFKRWSLKNNYKEGLTIDRIDNTVGYIPSNCRWVSQRDQAHNKTNNNEYVGVCKDIRRENYYARIKLRGHSIYLVSSKNKEIPKICYEIAREFIETLT